MPDDHRAQAKFVGAGVAGGKEACVTGRVIEVDLLPGRVFQRVDPCQVIQPPIRQIALLGCSELSHIIWRAEMEFTSQPMSDRTIPYLGSSSAIRVSTAKMSTSQVADSNGSAVRVHRSSARGERMAGPFV